MFIHDCILIDMHIDQYAFWYKRKVFTIINKPSCYANHLNILVNIRFSGFYPPNRPKSP